MCGSSVPSNSRACPDCGHLPEEKDQKSDTLSLKDRVEKIFDERGYEIKKEGFDGYDKTDQKIFAIYRARMHTDKVVVVCSDGDAPIDEEKVQELNRYIANSKANKGIMVASSYTSKGKKDAEKKGIDLLEVDDLPMESSFASKADFIQKKEGYTDLNIYYSVTGRCEKKLLFSQTFPDLPSAEALKKSFKRHSKPLSEEAIVVRTGRREIGVIDLREVYFIELNKLKEQGIKMEVYHYKGIDLDDDIEFKLKFSLRNNTEDTLQNLRLTGEVRGSDDHILDSVESRIDMDSDFYSSQTYMDSRHLFSVEFSGEPSEGEIGDRLKEKFEKEGFRLAEDAEIKKSGERFWIFEEGDEKYLLKQDRSLHVYQALGERAVNSLKPGSSLDYIVKTVLPLRIFPKHYDGLAMELELFQTGETLEKRSIDLSSSKSFKKAFREDLRDLKTSLESEVKKSQESPQEGRPGCFIATAVYGDPNAKKIDQLRAFRDEILLEKKAGVLFTELYYKMSPPIADFISEHESLRKAVGHIVVYPLVEIAEKALDPDRT